MPHEPSPEEHAWYEAWQQDHAWISMAANIREGLNAQQASPISWLQAARLATGLMDSYLDFQAEIEEAASRHRMRQRPLPIYCSVCGQPDCPAAKLVSEMSAPEQHSLLTVLHKQHQARQSRQGW